MEQLSTYHISALEMTDWIGTWINHPELMYLLGVSIPGFKKLEKYARSHLCKKKKSTCFTIRFVFTGSYSVCVMQGLSGLD